MTLTSQFRFTFLSVSVLQLLGESEIYGNEPGFDLPVRVVIGEPESFEADASKNADPLRGDALKKALKQSGRFKRFDDDKSGLWGYESYCKDRVCGYYTVAPKCQGACRKYYPDGSLGLGERTAVEIAERNKSQAT
uniref:Uncharacterized protein n=1 Tax=Chloropicon laureae TaxID=464258 RepID=A0A7S2Z2T0_9CHLO